ncbi:hypothetical protein H6G00_30395 [Leptolyngbya sp. FACHB-541]|uniref:hypothetical protein n=1 Tax=Leptolyngbya sp. FACHB-541 TaxID=2692810 RepID=UPI0016899864|nr:hypothetical protein [Leptolyngbya sp. FACHB-541]MBD2000862.1 hypothetical protein [Leptolyngbya sp. FACHB-541]
MNTHSLTKNNGLLKFLEFLPTHVSGISTPLQDDPSDQGNSSFTQYKQKRQNIQQVYYLERRCFF